MGAFRDFFIKIYTEGIKDPILLVVGKITDVADRIHDWNYIFSIDHAKTVARLESAWGVFPEHAKTDPQVLTAYNDKKEELTAEGMLTAADAALGLVGSGIAKAVYHIEANALPKILDWIDTFGAAYKMEKAELDSLKTLAQSGEFGLNAVVGFVLGVTVYPAVSAVTGPFWQKASHKSMASVRPALTMPEYLVRQQWRNIKTQAEYNTDMAKQGYTDKDMEDIEEVMRFYPAPADFIRFMVRDTFNEDVVKKYQYDADYPAEIDSYVAKAGLDPEWAKHYWRAHWELPSPMQTFEMLHRRKITLDDAKTILRVADIAPYFIEPFIAIAYNPVTRVDLRRLYQTGEYTEEDVYNGYLDIGSSPENARSLTNWTVNAYAPVEKELAKTEILKNYAIGQTTVEEVKRLLGVLEYEEPEILWILTYEDYRLEVAAREEEAETIIAEVINGTKTLPQAEDSFKALKFTQKTKTSYIERAKREVRKLQYQPPIATLKTWFEKGILTEDKFKERMSLMKVTEEDINNYIKEGASE